MEVSVAKGRRKKNILMFSFLYKHQALFFEENAPSLISVHVHRINTKEKI